MSSEAVYLLLLFVCLLLSAFFSSSETAFISLQRYRLKHLQETNVKGANRVAKLVEKPEKLLSTILLGNNLVNTAAAALATALAISYWGEDYGILFATVGLTIILLIFSETTPKTIATQHSERLSLLYARPIKAISWLLTPFVSLVSWVASAVSKMVGGESLHSSLITEEEIRYMITAGHKEGSLEEEETEMLHNIFEFGDTPVSEMLIPRPEVIAVEKGTTLGEFMKLYAENPVSRMPVFEENMDNVLGVISVKDVLMALSKGTINKTDPIDSLARPVYFTPESKTIGKLFPEMRDENYRMCVVVDEYGGTAGVVSLSRLMEEIVGPVGDELTEAEKDYETINEHTFQVDGSMRIEEANEEIGLNLPIDDDYETVAGFILHLLGYIPKQGKQVRYKNIKLVVTSMRGRKIDEILVTKEKSKEEHAEDKS